LLHLSSFTITLGKSNHYLRLVYLIYVFAVVVLWHSSLPLFVMICMLLILIMSLRQIVQSKTPVPEYRQLSYHKNYWLLHDIHEQETKYEQAHISFDAGLFILLSLTDEIASKKLVIFVDQLSPFQYRALNVIGKISPKKTSEKDLRR
jgi:hypothetical protein